MALNVRVRENGLWQWRRFLRLRRWYAYKRTFTEWPRFRPAVAERADWWEAGAYSRVEADTMKEALAELDRWQEERAPKS